MDEQILNKPNRQEKPNKRDKPDRLNKPDRPDSPEHRLHLPIDNRCFMNIIYHNENDNHRETYAQRIYPNYIKKKFYFFSTTDSFWTETRVR